MGHAISLILFFTFTHSDGLHDDASGARTPGLSTRIQQISKPRSRLTDAAQEPLGSESLNNNSLEPHYEPYLTYYYFQLISLFFFYDIGGECECVVSLEATGYFV